MHSRRTEPITRSQCALAFGAIFGVRMMRMPAPWATASKQWLNLQSLSRTRNLGASLGGVRLRRCCASQSEVGSVVDAARSSRRVSRCMTTKT